MAQSARSRTTTVRQRPIDRSSATSLVDQASPVRGCSTCRGRQAADAAAKHRALSGYARHPQKVPARSRPADIENCAIDESRTTIEGR